MANYHLEMVAVFVGALNHRNITDSHVVGSENHWVFHRYVQRAYKARLQRVVIAKLTAMVRFPNGTIAVNLRK